MTATCSAPKFTLDLPPMEAGSCCGGGATKDMSASWGYGDLEEDRFNVLGVFNYNKQQNLDANDRSFATDYAPGRGLDQTSGTAFPGNYSQNGNATNPLANSNCNGPNLIARDGLCRFSTREFIDLVPQTEKTSFFGKTTGKLADDHNVNLEYFWSRNNNATAVGPAPLTGLSLDSSSPYYPGNGITPGPTDFARILMHRLTIRGFIVIDFIPRAMEAIAELAPAVMSTVMPDWNSAKSRS